MATRKPLPSSCPCDGTLHVVCWSAWHRQAGLRDCSGCHEERHYHLPESQWGKRPPRQRVYDCGCQGHAHVVCGDRFRMMLKAA